MHQFIRHRHSRVSIASLLIYVLTFTMLPSFGVTTVRADHGDFEMAEGIYRIPYSDGTDISVGHDHHTHGGDDGPKNRYDLNAGVGQEIAAAASGWIRVIVDFNGNSPGAGDGVDINGDPQDDTLEHSCGNNPPEDTVVGSCSDYNNYVWIEHPNGEWSKYTHMGTGTVTALGWTADLNTHVVGAPNWIEAGEVLGLEGDIGQATNSNGPAYHLHWEIAIPLDSDDDLEWTTLGGFFTNGKNIVPEICDIGGNDLFDQGEDYTAAPCDNDPPTANDGGPYVVNEGSTVQLSGLGSSDPEGNPLTYAWSPAANLDDPSLAQPTYTGIDDSVNPIQLDVFDQIEQLASSDSTTITVNNVAPTVNAVGDTINEGQTATVSATITDPGTLDTHTATIDWGDGTQSAGITRVQLAAGVNHVYGDNGVYVVAITVTDDDNGVGGDTVNVNVNNLDPTLSLDTSDAVDFPGGSYLVVEAGSELPVSADGSDPGSDDLTFTWNTPEVNTYFNNGVSADLPMSPAGTFPFMASDSVDALYNAPGVETLGLVLSDDDGGSDNASVGVIVTGTADSSQGTGWWKHQYSGNGSPQIDAATAEGYLEIVNAVSSVFSETYAVNTMADVHAVLSPTGPDRRVHARAQLMVAWLQFASGAVDWDATIQLNSGPVAFLDLMSSAEAVINNLASTDAQLHAVELDLQRLHPSN
jgi:murein DD-endopeptidase MepM/ murein hydrolase activator NlpD